MRRLTESSGDGAKMALEMINAENRLGRVRSREGLKISGLINIGVGIGLLIFLHSLIGRGGPYLCGLIPLLIGVAMLVYVYALAAPLE